MELEEIYRIVEQYGFILTTNADEFIKNNYRNINRDKLLKLLTSHKELFIYKEELETVINVREKKRDVIREKIRVIFDPTKEITRGKGLEDYAALFKNRYEFLSRHILKNMKVKNVSPLSSLPLKKKPGTVEEVYVVGMIYSKKIWENKIMLEVEDESGRQRIFVFKNKNPQAFIQILETPLDSVVGLHIQILPSGMYTVKEVYYPSVKSKNGRANKDVYVVLTSDLHVGSAKFYEDEFKNFINILNGDVDNEKLRDIIEKIKYVIIGGDVVEGVGVFPEQKKELLISDIREQYKKAYELLSKIRKDIKVIITPGNHDAVRRSLPQPAIFKEFAEEFYRDRRFYMLGNPANICLHGVNIFVYHGDFLQDLFTITPGLSRENIGKALSIILKIRHSAPTYGLNTLIAPEKQDLLIIPEKIDIFHVGHTHKLYVGKINGILAINSGTWQAQTDYQKIYGIVPDPLKVPIVNLRTLETFVINLTY